MFAFRSRLHLVAIAWLLCQVASLAAFVPEDCCEKHTAIAAAKHHADEAPPCHETAETPAPAPEPGDDCPMNHGDGAACPMHKSSTGECCGMSRSCDGPNRPLAHLFAYGGVIEAPAASLNAPTVTQTAAPPSAPLLYRLVSPDAPPPKA